MFLPTIKAPTAQIRVPCGTPTVRGGLPGLDLIVPCLLKGRDGGAELGSRDEIPSKVVDDHWLYCTRMGFLCTARSQRSCIYRMVVRVEGKARNTFTKRSRRTNEYFIVMEHYFLEFSRYDSINRSHIWMERHALCEYGYAPCISIHFPPSFSRTDKTVLSCSKPKVRNAAALNASPSKHSGYQSSAAIFSTFQIVIIIFIYQGRIEPLIRKRQRSRLQPRERRGASLNLPGRR